MGWIARIDGDGERVERPRWRSSERWFCFVTCKRRIEADSDSDDQCGDGGDGRDNQDGFPWIRWIDGVEAIRFCGEFLGEDSAAKFIAGLWVGRRKRAGRAGRFDRAVFFESAERLENRTHPRSACAGARNDELLVLGPRAEGVDAAPERTGFAFGAAAFERRGTG